MSAQACGEIRDIAVAVRVKHADDCQQGKGGYADASLPERVHRLTRSTARGQAFVQLPATEQLGKGHQRQYHHTAASTPNTLRISAVATRDQKMK